MLRPDLTCSQHEQEYIEALKESDRLQVFQPKVAEVWRLAFKTPPPSTPRTFVILLLTKETKPDPRGERAFINISIPFHHPDCVPKEGKEKSRVRGKYVSVERIQETEGGRSVEWRMATSSDAGGDIPQILTRVSLPSSIAEDVPCFLEWLAKRSI
ncbi:uncharacterized protein MKK02DRAFT_20263 [Dioszegia hungarica]|uniref:DUF3074 domain-containing protein n=1 Tax=Dioszegia hungarica TaxID=4972 RepID=A0AA38H206_9TREE|nr:uncharacterized protein MKK02DRAFT_20263 [Dioszegia hungarica]KAI9632257.1 hypothetical protein MKK02DRAFT_20263 [Dioszegia hungarica]